MHINRETITVTYSKKYSSNNGRIMQPAVTKAWQGKGSRGVELHPGATFGKPSNLSLSNLSGKASIVGC